MGDVAEAAGDASAVRADAVLRDIAAEVLSAAAPLRVVDGDGTTVGSVSRDAVIDAIWGSATSEVGDSG